jgi:quercetin dioxygenase-like cupin family protein
MKALTIGAFACVAMMTGAAFAAGSMSMNVVAGSEAVKWGPAPPVLPPGAQMAVMAGDPAKPGFVSLRAKLPAGYTIPPHTHPTDEHVTVLSGDMSFGMGDKIDAASEQAVQPGGYFVAQAQMHHYATTKSGAVIQVDLEGPFDITYVNSADDPRNKGK